MTYINEAFEKVMRSVDGSNSAEEVVLLQYGSAYFEADDTEESDFDILMVCKSLDLESFVRSSSPSVVTMEASEMRSIFFFGAF